MKPDEVEYLARRFAGLAGIELSEDLEELEVQGLSYFGPPLLLLVEHLMEVLHLTHWVDAAVADRRLKVRVVDALKVMLCADLFKNGSRAELAVWDWQQKLFWHAHRVPDLGYHQLLRSLPVLVTESGFGGVGMAVFNENLSPLAGFAGKAVLAFDGKPLRDLRGRDLAGAIMDGPPDGVTTDAERARVSRISPDR